MIRAKSAVGCLEGWRSPARTLPPEWHPRSHPPGVVWAQPPTGAKLVGSTGQSRSTSGYLAVKVFTLKSPVEVCAVYIFPWILYRLSVLRLSKVHRLALIQSLSKLLWSDRNPMVCRQVCSQRPWNGEHGMPEMESLLLAERLAYLGRSLSGDTVWGQKVRDIFPRLESDPEAEGLRKPKGAAPFTCECQKALH